MFGATETRQQCQAPSFRTRDQPLGWSRDATYRGCGNGRIDDGPGSDIILGESGNDSLAGGSDNARDVVFGDAGFDTLSWQIGDVRKQIERIIWAW